MDKEYLLEFLSFEDFFDRFGFDTGIIKSFIKGFHFYENDKGDIFGVFEDTFMNFNFFRIVGGEVVFFSGVSGFAEGYYNLFKLMHFSDISFPIIYSDDLYPYQVYIFKGHNASFTICFDGRKYKILDI